MSSGHETSQHIYSTRLPAPLPVRPAYIRISFPKASSHVYPPTPVACSQETEILFLTSPRLYHALLDKSTNQVNK